MKIVFKKSFIKHYGKLAPNKRKSVDTTIKVFMDNPWDPKLKNHALLGGLKGKRAIAAGFDIRIIFKVKGDYLLVEMLAVGSHNQVY